MERTEVRPHLIRILCYVHIIGRFKKVRSGQTGHFENEVGFFEDFGKNLSLLCVLYCQITLTPTLRGHRKCP